MYFRAVCSLRTASGHSKLELAYCRKAMFYLLNMIHLHVM